MTSERRQIIAMGGGGFSMEPESLALDRYVLSAAQTAEPSVCFLGTASGDSKEYIERFYTSFRSLPCSPSHLSLFQPHTTNLRAFLLAQDVIYVGGGSTRNLLVLWREWGLDKILLEAWQAGIVLAGISAGALCWFESGVSDSVRANELHPIQCLGFVRGSFCPHYDGEVERRPAYHRLLREGRLRAGYAADDGAALHFRGTALFQPVTSRAAASAYSLEIVEGNVSETALKANFLG
jgi:dipeptidase E